MTCCYYTNYTPISAWYYSELRSALAILRGCNILPTMQSRSRLIMHEEPIELLLVNSGLLRKTLLHCVILNNDTH